MLTTDIFDGNFLLIGEDGANLIARSTPIAFRAKGKIWINNHAHVLKAKSETCNEFLEFFINNIDLKKYVTGTAQPKLTQRALNSIIVLLPPLLVQHQIVAILQQAEATKRLRTESDELTQRFLQSVFMEMFGDPVKNEKGWDVKNLKQMVSNQPNSIKKRAIRKFHQEGILCKKRL